MKLFLSSILIILPLLTYSQYSIKECGQKPREVKKTKYNQSQEDFEKSDKYLNYLSKYTDWKSCVDSLNSSRLYSQKLKLDDNGQVVIDTVLIVDNQSKDELYSAAREWVASNFNSATDVLKMDDRTSGKLIAKGFADITYKTLYTQKAKCFFTIKIYCKENRYRVIWTDFENQYYDNQFAPDKFSSDYLLQNPYKDDGITPQETRASMKEGILKMVFNNNESLRKAMESKTNSDDGTNDDW